MIEYDQIVNRVKEKSEYDLEKVIDILWSLSQIEGSHHRGWCIDQIARHILKSEYDNFIKLYESNDYDWDVGIAP